MEEGEEHHKYTLFKCKFYFALTGYIVLACFMLCWYLKKFIWGHFQGSNQEPGSGDLLRILSLEFTVGAEKGKCRKLVCRIKLSHLITQISVNQLQWARLYTFLFLISRFPICQRSKNSIHCWPLFFFSKRSQESGRPWKARKMGKSFLISVFSCSH